MTMSQPTRAILTTGNIMTAGAEVIRKPTLEKSNTELINSLRENIRSASLSAPPSPSCSSTSSGNSNDNRGDSVSPRPPKHHSMWTYCDPNTGDLYIPTPPSAHVRGLVEERSEYDITVKMFHLPGAPTETRAMHLKTAVSHVLRMLNISHIDLLILSFPGIVFDADDDDDSAAAPSMTPSVDPLASYRALEDLHDAGMVSRLGISEFGTTRLMRLLQESRVKPSVDQINLRDCCVLPKSLILFAKKEGIELLTHNDCTDILPSRTLRELVAGEGGCGVLGEDCGGSGEGRDLVPQWVIKYTAVTRSRGVVENKGYIAMAEMK